MYAAHGVTMPTMVTTLTWHRCWGGESYKLLLGSASYVAVERMRVNENAQKLLQCLNSYHGQSHISAPHLGISKAHSNIKLCTCRLVLGEELKLCTYRLVFRMYTASVPPECKSVYTYICIYVHSQFSIRMCLGNSQMCVQKCVSAHDRVNKT